MLSCGGIVGRVVRQARKYREWEAESLLAGLHLLDLWLIISLLLRTTRCPSRPPSFPRCPPSGTGRPPPWSFAAQCELRVYVSAQHTCVFRSI
ncbi:hypothetical protein K432DRAFT_196676 [Lepidopterella palustris CBS 459.81]|uniref:Uncharacterized protein n=1 Tax=Lepidopterella palustris CBS 459.81 TaxID=1314670 RepID=A0A8E2EFP4_9PEZI|nr:hypothetical protein K432DRAFT_196676 [Lepidopterella palustris CBS 459.81]